MRKKYAVTVLLLSLLMTGCDNNKNGMEQGDYFEAESSQLTKNRKSTDNNSESAPELAADEIYLYHKNQVKMLAEGTRDYEKIVDEIEDVFAELDETTEIIDGSIGFAGYGEALSKDTKEYWIEINFAKPVSIAYKTTRYTGISSLVISLEEDIFYSFRGERIKGDVSCISFMGFMAKEDVFTELDFIKTYFEESEVEKAVKENFKRMKSTYSTETLISSNPYDYIENKYYEDVVSIGMEAVPVLEEIVDSKEWSSLERYIAALAIQEITGCNLYEMTGEDWATAEEFSVLWKQMGKELQNSKKTK